MAQYNIPITWQAMKTYTVEAENLQEAVERALKQFLSEPDDTYLSDTFDIDNILEDDYPKETYNMKEILEKI